MGGGELEAGPRQTTGVDDAGVATRSGAAEVPQWDQWMDSLLVLLLALASLLVAWSGYQANAWGGEQTTANQEAATRRLESTRDSTIGSQKMQLDLALAMTWLNALQSGNTELADFYAARFSPELAVAHTAWLATDPLHNPDAPKSPFAMPEYQIPELQEADRLETESNQLIEAGKTSNAYSDRYVATTVILAIVLFFSGIAPQIRWRPARLVLVGFAVMLFAFCLVQITRLPVAPGSATPFQG